MKAKKRLFVLTFAMLLIFVVPCICSNSSCSTDIDNTADSSTESETPTFNIASSKEIYQLGDDAVSLSIDGSLPEGFSSADVSFFIEFADESTECTILEDNTLEFIGTGKAVIKAQVGEIYSNSVTVYSVLPNSQVTENLRNVFEGAVYLGLNANVGIHPSTAHLYSIENGDGYTCINEKGMLEFIGIRAAQTHIKVCFQEELLYEGMFSTEGHFKKAILQSFVDYEIIPNLYTDVSNEMLKNATQLKVQYTVCPNIDEYSFLSYCQSLKELDLTGSPLFDLSFLQSVDKIETLILDNCDTLTNVDNSLTLQKTLSSLTSLNLLSIDGSFSCFDRNSYELLISMVMREDFKLRVLEDVILDPTNASGFSETVFFSMSEYLNHIESHGNQIAPHEGFSHAILCLNNDKTSVATNNYIKIDATPVSILELYGDERRFGTYISSKTDLTLNLYNYHIDISKNYAVSAVAIQNGNLNLNARRGECSLTAGNGRVYEWWGEFTDPGAGIYARDCTVNLSSGTFAKLRIYGGRGADGFDGFADGSNPTDRHSKKHGACGGEGGCGIYAETINFLYGTIVVYGGAGGNGGDGADGTGVNIFNGGYDAGNGNSGGVGGYGIVCRSYTISEICVANLYGGAGGPGGEGGDGYLAGKDGEDYEYVYHGEPYADTQMPNVSDPVF